MRAEGTRNAIWLKAYAGTTGVMLAMNVTTARRTGLLGFAVEREGPAGEHRWLRGLLRFPGQGGARLSPIDSAKAPIQKFRWSDYSVYPDSAYRYRVHGVYGSPQALKLVRGGEVSLKTEPLAGLHQVIFNRAAAASQAYARRFGNANPDAPGNEEARRWLSRGLREKLLAFIERAQGPDWAIDVAIYEIELPEVVDSLESALRRGVGVRVVYHAKAGDPQTAENERHLARLPGPLKKARVTASIFHQKFVVLSRLAADGRRQPTAVLTGSMPVIITGSNNFSNASSAKNDENMLVLKGQTSAADTYVCEMMRLYDHYRFRFNQQSPAGRGPAKRLQLSPDDSWAGRYFETGNLLALERERFCPMK